MIVASPPMPSHFGLSSICVKILIALAYCGETYPTMILTMIPSAVTTSAA